MLGLLDLHVPKATFFHLNAISIHISPLKLDESASPRQLAISLFCTAMGAPKRIHVAWEAIDPFADVSAGVFAQESLGFLGSVVIQVDEACV